MCHSNTKFLQQRYFLCPPFLILLILQAVEYGISSLNHLSPYSPCTIFYTHPIILNIFLVNIIYIFSLIILCVSLLLLLSTFSLFSSYLLSKYYLYFLFWQINCLTFNSLSIFPLNILWFFLNIINIIHFSIFIFSLDNGNILFLIVLYTFPLNILYVSCSIL